MSLLRQPNESLASKCGNTVRFEDGGGECRSRAVAKAGESDHIACNDIGSMQAKSMAQLTVRNVNEQIVRVLKQQAAAHGRSAEAEHREILRAALLEGEEDFAARARALRRRLHSSVDSSEVIRADRDRDHAG